MLSAMRMKLTVPFQGIAQFLAVKLLDHNARCLREDADRKMAQHPHHELESFVYSLIYAVVLNVSL